VTRYLLPEQVLFIHYRLIEETGGEHGVRDLALLLSALGRPQATFDGKELYTNVFFKAAALMDSLIRNHPFIDGNKRTAITSIGLFLRLNGYVLRVEQDEIVRFTLACAQSQKSLEEIRLWLQEHSE
jgi:death-on-curing protein